MKCTKGDCSLSLKDYIGEATSYDKKLMLERKDPTSWLKSVSAFANTHGGRLLFGVANDGSLAGLADAQGDAEFISEAIKMQMDPVPEIDLSLHEEDGKRFVVVEIKTGSETPYYTFVKGHRDAFVRIGNESVRADAIQLKRLVLKGAHRSWDSLTTPFSRKDYSFEVLYATYHESTKISFEESDFQSFGLVSDKGLLTNAGALFADHSPIRYSRIFCTRWNGLTKSNGVMDALDDDEFSGGIITLLEKGFDFVRTNSKKKWRKTLKGRVEYPEYPLHAVREGIVNGLIHRDYLELGSEVHIDMFDDRIEIFSPGGMMSGVPVQKVPDLRKVGSMRRNPVIADLFQRLDLMERRGSGFGKILDAYMFASEQIGQHVAPSFVSDPSGFVVTLPNLHYVASHGDVASFAGVKKHSAKRGAKSSAKRGVESSAKSGAKNGAIRQGRPAGKNERIIFRAIRDNSHVSIAELQRKTRLSNGGVRKIISVLKSKGRIVRVGGTNGGHWEVMK